MNHHTSFARDLLDAVIAAFLVLMLAIVGLAILVFAGWLLYVAAGVLADLISRTSDVGRAALAVGVMALLWLLFSERERTR